MSELTKISKNLAKERYRLNNPDKIKQFNQTYYKKHKEEILKKQREKYHEKKLRNQQKE